MLALPSLLVQYIARIAHQIGDKAEQQQYRQHCEYKRVQRILNSRGASLNVDGLMGPKTLEAIHACDPKWLIDEIIKNRYYHYRQNVYDDLDQLDFYKGWIKRLNCVAEKVGSKIRYPIEF